ncbi:MAG: DUF3592 domain-containing protein [Bacteroidota bacterium]
MAFHLTAIDKFSVMLIGLWPKILLGAILLVLFILIMAFRVADFDSLHYIFNDTLITDGYVDKVTDTDYTANDRPVLQYFYTFQIEDATFLNHSYSSQTFYDAGERVKVEYVESNPNISRIIGTKNAEFSMILTFVMGIVSIVLIVLARKSYYKSQKMIDLLYNRVPDEGKQVSKEETMTTVNDKILYELGYEYHAHDDPFICYVYTTSPREYLMEEPLFYSKNDPEHAILYRDLPKRLLGKLNVKEEKL